MPGAKLKRCEAVAAGFQVELEHPETTLLELPDRSLRFGRSCVVACPENLAKRRIFGQ